MKITAAQWIERANAGGLEPRLIKVNGQDAFAWSIEDADLSKLPPAYDWDVPAIIDELKELRPS